MDTETPRIFISYSHDSSEQKRRVLGLANRLRADGIDARLDQYEEAPVEGWPRWMEHEISEADFVLLICTENYHERVMSRPPHVAGHGVLWESSLIYQHLYEAGTVNSKFIPALPPNGSTQHIPTILRGFQRYEPFTEDGYQDLYRRVTAQPRVLRPPLGRRKAVPQEQEPPFGTPVMTRREQVACSSSPRAAIISERDNIQAFIPVVESSWDEQEANLVLEPDLPEDGAFLEGLRGSRFPILVAYRNGVALAYVEGVQRRTEGRIDRWRLTARIHQSDFSNNMEMSMTGLTADDAAVLRARRLLLNDQPSDADAGANGVIRDILIAGQGTVLQVKGSPFPILFRAFRHRPQMFIESSWILAVLYLRASAVVEHVTKLSLELADDQLQVQCSGRRARKYMNRPAFEVHVAGTCHL